ENVALTKSGDRIGFDLFLGVPVHRAPPVVVSAELASAGGWVAVDQHTMETRFSGVYALGDVTHVPVGQGAVPKAGAFADRAARAVATDIIHRLRGEGPRGHFDGAGTCYLEFGEGRVAMIDANFLGGAAPVVRFEGPSPDLLPKKLAFAHDRVTRWFGR
ncbi:MAG TPA: FAD/NAD(P)-binding oxidoreductase, partial [Gemmatimonadales bacterium]|nr:FAD/NAD(P)-binding oxidoreductase [Gemmatimonadales bacterium]